jgi:Holliday junction resolvasome RuvABC ATP-dependent DNA helicase subunit
MKRRIKYQQLPMFITRLVMGRGLAKMFSWVNHHDVIFVEDIDALKKQFPAMLRLEEWIKIHFG